MSVLSNSTGKFKAQRIGFGQRLTGQYLRGSALDMEDGVRTIEDGYKKLLVTVCVQAVADLRVMQDLGAITLEGEFTEKHFRYLEVGGKEIKLEDRRGAKRIGAGANRFTEADVRDTMHFFHNGYYAAVWATFGGEVDNRTILRKLNLITEEEGGDYAN